MTSDPEATDPKPFLSRWSNRKRTAATADPADQSETELEESAEPALEGMSEADILEELGLPEPESLAPGDDFSAFMKSTVPQHLRTRALRKLWGTNPVLANVDGLVDYGGDFTDAATVVPDMKTLYQVGKGIFHPQEEELPEELTEEVAEELAGPEEGESTENPTIADLDGEEALETYSEQEVAEKPQFAEDMPVEHTPRRMTFNFHDAE